MNDHSMFRCLMLLAADILLIASSMCQITNDQSVKKRLVRDEVTLWMKWQRGDRVYGPDFIRLFEPCQNSKESGCECQVRFATRSTDFADYISSFGESKVPIVYEVIYGEDDQVRTARFLSVGTWPREKFPSPNDGLIGVQFRDPGPSKHQLSAPSACFRYSQLGSTRSSPSLPSKLEAPVVRGSTMEHAERPTRAEITQTAAEALLINKTKPEYPQDAIYKHIQGTVLLKAEVSEQGAVTDLSLISGHPLLAPAAIEAVKQWIYKPYVEDGKAVAFETQVQVDFRLPSN